MIDSVILFWNALRGLARSRAHPQTEIVASIDVVEIRCGRAAGGMTPDEQHPIWIREPNTPRCVPPQKFWLQNF
jgi:hypothetical protein